MIEIALYPIGIVRSERTSKEDADWGVGVSTIELDPALSEGLEGLEQFSHAVIVFFLHEGEVFTPPRIKRRPREREDMPLLGVFAQRGKVRPNPIGVTTAKIVSVEPGRLIVSGLDAIDGTPVLDIKPYFSAFDHADDAAAPEWVDRLMEGYF